MDWAKPKSKTRDAFVQPPRMFAFVQLPRVFIPQAAAVSVHIAKKLLGVFISQSSLHECSYHQVATVSVHITKQPPRMFTFPNNHCACSSPPDRCP
ncbi:hypothetical protein AMTR_s00027p00075110 [Amborella trichopoda]|uniref:Uncharacterized protein n=1 Tax=Amborella trichopoda TaxID=13333 RepID=W1PL51_AMBTC|nr:hypothetical protein AMTR_s00027p00075110 [Amborella trichopoda]